VNGIARAMIAGNIVRDPELRYTPQGRAVTNISLAVNRKRGEDSEVVYLEVTFWEKHAETLCQYLRKGDPLLITAAEIYQREKIVNEGTDKERREWKTCFTGREFLFLPDGRKGGKHDPAPESTIKPERERQPQPADAAREDEDRMPF
jgi:single-strand DNA-binding protein